MMPGFEIIKQPVLKKKILKGFTIFNGRSYYMYIYVVHDCDKAITITKTRPYNILRFLQL